MKKSILFFLILSGFSASNAQIAEEWVQRYNGPGNSVDYANSIALDSSGNVYVTGTSCDSLLGYDYCSIKYNSSGVEQWIQRYNGPGNLYDYSNSIAVDNSGNVYVTGSSFGIGTNYDYCTIKYNAWGMEQWVKRYNGPGNLSDGAKSIAVDNSSNVYVTGGSGGNYCTIKYDTWGAEQWVQRYNGLGIGGNNANSIAVDNLGNVYVSGSSCDSLLRPDYCTIKYNSSGVEQWVRRYKGPGNSGGCANSIVVDNLGSVYVTGYSNRSGTYYDYCTIKYNTSGVEQWVQRYNGPGNFLDEAISIAVDNSGNVYVTGYSYGNEMNDDYCTIKYNTSGVEQWVRRYNGRVNSNDWAFSIALDDSSNVYVTGQSIISATSYDYCTIKYNTSGVEKWIQIYNGPGDSVDCAFSIAVDNSGGVYVTGWSCGSGTREDYCTIKYHEPIGIKPISSEVPLVYSLSQNYPNPFNPVTKIKFEIPKTGGVILAIYDILGCEVTTLVNEYLKPGEYEAEWDGSNYSSGIYFYKLITPEYIGTKKMVLVK